MDFDKAYQLIWGKLNLWLREFVRLLPNLVLAALVLVLGLYLARVFRKLASRLFTHHRALNNLFTSFIYVLAIGITIFITLDIIKLDKAVTSLLAGAGIIGIALAFAFQDIAANFVAGIVMSFTRPMEIGDIIKANDYMGKVESIHLRDTIIRTFQGQMVIIPNKDIFQNPIENYSMLGKRRLDLAVGVSYGEDLNQVRKLAVEAVKNVPARSTEDEVTLFFTEFADSSINFNIRIWLNSPEESVFLKARSEAIISIKEIFDTNNIMIPFPIRTLDFAIKGGEKLQDQPLPVSIRSDDNRA